MASIKKATCENCNAVTEHELVNLPLRNHEGEDMSFRCTVCGKVMHSYYINAKLEKMQAEARAINHPIQRDHALRAYKRKFAAFNDSMKSKYAAGGLGGGH